MNFPSIADHGGNFGGGFKINGVEETYMVANGETIKAGDFVSFVNKTKTSGQVKKMFKLLNFYNNNAYIYSNSSSMADHGKIICINNNTFVVFYTSTTFGSWAIYQVDSVGNITLKGSGTFNSGQATYIDAVLIDTNKILLVYADANTNNYGYAMVGTISGYSISFGSRYGFKTTNTCNLTKVIKLDTNNAVVIYSDANTATTSTRVLTVSGTTITVNTEYLIGNYYINYPHYDAILVDTNKILFCNRRNDNKGVAVILSINGTDISVGTFTVFNTNAYYISLSKITSSQAIVFFRNADNNNYGTSVVLSISGTNISVETLVVFNTAQSDYIKSSNIGNNTFLLSFVDGNNSYLSSMLLQVNNNVITIIESAYIWGFNGFNRTVNTIQSMNENMFLMLFIDYNANYKLKVGIFNIYNYISGIAKTSGTSGQQIKVITL